MSKNLVYHPESVRHTENYLFNNPFFPSATPGGRVRDSLYSALSTSRRVSDEKRMMAREDLDNVFPDLYSYIMDKNNSKATFQHQGTSIGMRAGGGALLLVLRTPHHLLHSISIEDALLAPVPSVSIEVDGVHECINKHEAYTLASKAAAVALTSLQLDLVS